MKATRHPGSLAYHACFLHFPLSPLQSSCCSHHGWVLARSVAFCPKQMGLNEMLGEEIAGLMSYEAHTPILFNNFGTMGVGVRDNVKSVSEPGTVQYHC